MKFKMLALAIAAVLYTGDASAFNDFSCEEQAKMIAQTITTATVGKSTSQYTVKRESSANGPNNSVVITYSAWGPDNNSMSLQIEITFSNFGGTNEATGCFVDQVKVLGAG